MTSPAVLSRSARSTRSLARRMARGLSPGAVLALVGDLGAGKTTFVQGLAEGLEVFDLAEVVSPTYALVNEYAAPGAPLVHVDFYRLDEPDTVRALGIEEQLYRKDAVLAVEWADKLPDLLPPHTTWIHIDRIDENTRNIWGQT